MKLEEIEIIKQFFFRGMLNGYVNPNFVKLTDLQAIAPQMPDGFIMPGSKCTVYREKIDDDFFQLIDVWFSRKDCDFSGGMTVIISSNNGPVWMMNYGGHYSEEAIPTLKLALRTAYEQKDFHGGRGHEKFSNGDYLYSNDFQHGDFSEFYGYENMFKAGKSGPIQTWLGRHSYHGFLLAPVEK